MIFSLIDASFVPIVVKLLISVRQTRSLRTDQSLGKLHKIIIQSFKTIPKQISQSSHQHTPPVPAFELATQLRYADPCRSLIIREIIFPVADRKIQATETQTSTLLGRNRDIPFTWLNQFYLVAYSTCNVQLRRKGCVLAHTCEVESHSPDGNTVLPSENDSVADRSAIASDISSPTNDVYKRSPLFHPSPPPTSPPRCNSFAGSVHRSAGLS